MNTLKDLLAIGVVVVAERVVGAGEFTMHHERKFVIGKIIPTLSSSAPYDVTVVRIVTFRIRCMYQTSPFCHAQRHNPKYVLSVAIQFHYFLFSAMERFIMYVSKAQ